MTNITYNDLEKLTRDLYGNHPSLMADTLRCAASDYDQILRLFKDAGDYYPDGSTMPSLGIGCAMRIEVSPTAVPGLIGMFKDGRAVGVMDLRNDVVYDLRQSPAGDVRL